MDIASEQQSSQAGASQALSRVARTFPVTKISDAQYAQLRQVFIDTTLSLEDIATAHDVSYDALRKRAQLEGWVGLREVQQARLKAETRPLDIMPYDERAILYRRWDERHLKGIRMVEDAALAMVKKGVRTARCPDCKGKGGTGKGEDYTRCHLCDGEGWILRGLDPGELLALVGAIKQATEVERKVHTRDMPLKTFGPEARGFGQVNVLVNNPMQLAERGEQLRALQAEAAVVVDGEYSEGEQ